MNERLQVEIGADISELKSALKQTESAISRVEKDIKETTVVLKGYEKAHADLSRELKSGNITQQQYDKNLKRLTRDEQESKVAVQNLKRELSSLRGSYRDLGGSAQTLTRNTNQLGKSTKANATPAMMEFSRVIQDAPYGIMGVGNNIQQLVGNFGNLQRSAGGTGAALKAMLGTLAGPGGILLAVSAVTTLLTVFREELGELVSSTNKLTEATKDYLGEAKAEVTELRSLVSIASNYSNSLNVRQAAINKLNDKYGDYLGNLDEERLKTDEVKKAIDRLSISLIQQAKIRGLQDRITKEQQDSAGELIELEMKQEKAVKSVQSQVNQLIKGSDLLNRTIGDVKGINNQIAALEKLANRQDDVGQYVREQISGVQVALSEYKKVNSELDKVEQNTNKALQPLINLKEKIQKQVFELDAQLTFSQEEVVVEGGKKPEVKVTPKVDEAELAELNRKIAQAQEEGKFIERELGFIMPLENAIGDAGYANFLNEQWATLEEGYGAHVDRMNEKSDILAAKQQAVSGIIGQAFSGLGNLIGEEFDSAGDAMAEFTKELIRSVGKMLLGIAAQVIANAVLAGSQSAVATGPAAAFTLTPLIAGAVAGAQSFIPKFAEGGMVGGTSYAGDKILARLNSGEGVLTAQGVRNAGMLVNAVSSGGASSMDVNVISRISGDDIILVTDRAQRKRNRIG